MSVHNYTELAAHHEHEIHVVLYGGGQNAAVECETCSDVLFDFDQHADGESPAELAALIALGERHRLCEHDLSDHVRQAAREIAVAVNSQDLPRQLAYLCTVAGAERTREMIDELARTRRRR